MAKPKTGVPDTLNDSISKERVNTRLITKRTIKNSYICLIYIYTWLTFLQLGFMRDHLNCLLDRISNHLGDKFQGISLREFLDRLSWSAPPTHICGQQMEGEGEGVHQQSPFPSSLVWKQYNHPSQTSATLTSLPSWTVPPVCQKNLFFHKQWEI